MIRDYVLLRQWYKEYNSWAPVPLKASIAAVRDVYANFFEEDVNNQGLDFLFPYKGGKPVDTICHMILSSGKRLRGCGVKKHLECLGYGWNT